MNDGNNELSAIRVYWIRHELGKNGKTMREEEVLSAISAYKAKGIELEMKSFLEYPMK